MIHKIEHGVTVKIDEPLWPIILKLGVFCWIPLQWSDTRRAIMNPVRENILK